MVQVEASLMAAEANTRVQAVAGGGVLTSGAVICRSSHLLHHHQPRHLNCHYIATLRCWGEAHCFQRIMVCQHRDDIFTICCLWSAELSEKWQCNVMFITMSFWHDFPYKMINCWAEIEPEEKTIWGLSNARRASGGQIPPQAGWPPPGAALQQPGAVSRGAAWPQLSRVMSDECRLVSQIIDIDMQRPHVPITGESQLLKIWFR